MGLDVMKLNLAIQVKKLESEKKELLQACSEYLSHPSKDGSVKRHPTRKKLEELVKKQLVKDIK